MARKAIRSKDIQNPDNILSKLLQDYIEGNLDDNRILFRAYVVEVDHVGGNLETSPAPNPPGSIKARIITDARDQNTSDDDLSVFWPLFPFDLWPIKETEHVYVLFEDPDTKEHGLWVTRIPEPNDIHNYNFTPGSKKYILNSDNNLQEGSAAEKIIQDTNKEPTSVTPSENFVVEDTQTPLFVARVGDRVIHGSNNTIIVLGRDRPTNLNSGIESFAGTIDIVSGRIDEKNMNLSDDLSRIYISSKTDVDSNFSIKGDPGPVIDSTAAIAIKSNEIRVIARTGMKIVVEGGDLHIESTGDINVGIDASNVNIGVNGNINLGGENAAESIIQGNLFNNLWQKLLNLIANHNHPSPVPNAPSPTLAQLATPANNDLSNAATGPVLSQTVKTKG